MNQDCPSPYEADPLLRDPFDLRHLCADFGALGALSAGITVVRVNPPPTPLQFRVLASYETLWPQGFAPFGGDLFLPLESQVAAVA